MKRLIIGSSQRTLTLAKGIVVPSYALNSDQQSQYADFYVPDLGWYGAYVFVSECEYDPMTGNLSGNLSNHETLIRKYGLENIESYNKTYFRVDLTDDRQHTELTLSGSKLYFTDLEKMFNVTSDRLNIADDEINEWEDINSSEFRRKYELAAHKAEQQILEYNRSEDAELSYGVPKFAICFAIINSKDQVGLVAESGELFSAVDVDDYKNQTKRAAAMYGLKVRDALFKTVYSNKWEEPLKGKSIGSKHFTEEYRLCNYVRDYFQPDDPDEENPVSVTKNTLNQVCEILVKDGKLGSVSVSDKVLDIYFEPDKAWGSGRMGTLHVPAGLRLTPDVAEAIYDELS